MNMVKKHKIQQSVENYQKNQSQNSHKMTKNDPALIQSLYCY